MNLIQSLSFIVLGLTQADQKAIDRFSPFFRFFYEITNSPTATNWLMFISIIVLSVVVYKLGFAKELPLLKSAIIYLILVIGSTILTFLAIFLPIAEGLVVAALIMGIYRIRLRNERKSGTI